MTLSTLISRLEAASEGSEELDVAITRATCGYKPTDPLWHTMEFTRSLDAALTLVPEGQGWRFLLDQRAGAKHRQDGYRAHVWNGTTPRYEDTETWAPTPALALCIAALKAREQDDD